MVRTVFMIGLVMAVAFSGNVLASEAYYGFLEEPINSRALAMGSAGSATIGTGGFSFYNPALPSIQKPSVTIEFGKLYDDLGRGLLEIEYSFPKWFIGVSIQSQSVSFEYADEKGVKSGSEGSEQGVMASLAAGFKKEKFSAGLSVNGIHHRIANDYSMGISASAGALYQIIPGKLTGGAAILHFYGRNSRHLDTTKHLHHDMLPVTGRAGVSWIDSIKGKIPYTVSTDIVYSFNYEKLMVPIGVEAWILPALAVRLGKRFNHPTDVITMGIGLKVANIKYDVAFTPVRLVSDVEMKWSMNLTYDMPSLKKKPHTTQTVVDSVDPIQKNSTFRVDDTTKSSADSVKTPVAPVSDSASIESDSASIEKELLKEDSTSAIIIEIEKTSENEISSDSVLAQETTTKTTTASGAKNEAQEVNVTGQTNVIPSEKKEAESSEPVDIGTVKAE